METIEEILNEVNAKKRYEETKYQRLLLSDFEDTYNPLKFYNRMIEDLGINKKEARRVAEIYELGIYSDLIKYIRREK